MNKDMQLLQEAYTAIFEKKSKGWTPPWLKDKKEDKEDKEDGGKKAKKHGKNSRPDKDGDGVPDWADKKDDSKKKKGKSLAEAYAEIVEESKHINKKFARRYNKVTGELLKSDPGSKHYTKLKSERDELVKILADHGMTPADLDSMLTKTEKDEVATTEEPHVNKEEETAETKPEVCSQCGDGHSKDKCPENCY
jgi:hypothetical protein